MTQTITIQLPDELAEQVRALDLLTDETVSILFEQEIIRRQQAAAARLTEIAQVLQADFRAEFGDLTEEEAQAIIDGWIEEADRGEAKR